MAEDEKPEIPTGGKKKLVLILVVVNVLAIGGVGYFVMAGGDSEAAADDGEGEAEQEESESQASFGPLVEMRALVANLNDIDGGRYVKVTPPLELKDEAARAGVEAALVPIRNELLVYFSDVTVEQCIGADSKRRIADEIAGLINEMMGGKTVKRVFFTEFVVQ